MRAYIRRDPAKLALPNGVFSYKSKSSGASSVQKEATAPIDGEE
jgi:hypothetical protein